MSYDTKRWFEGSRWYDQYKHKEVVLVYCRGTTDFRVINTDTTYGVPYDELEDRMIRIKIPEYVSLTLNVVEHVADYVVVDHKSTRFYIQSRHMPFIEKQVKECEERGWTPHTSLVQHSDYVIANNNELIKCRALLTEVVQNHIRYTVSSRDPQG